LLDWTRHPDLDIRHHSGRARYRKTFDLPPGRFPVPAAGVFLDLGEVRDLAAVRLNGRDLGTLWHAPFRVGIGDVVRQGRNLLEVDVVNVWNNRIAGDLSLPAERRRTVLLSPTGKSDAPLLPEGLMGPVRVDAVTRQELRRR
jgi:hypothetical protein